MPFQCGGLDGYHRWRSVRGWEWEKKGMKWHINTARRQLKEGGRGGVGGAVATIHTIQSGCYLSIHYTYPVKTHAAHTPGTKKDTFSAAKSVTCNHSASVLPFCLRLPHARSRTKGGEGEKEGGRRGKKE